MTTCPLPVDWLDLLEGRPSPADRAHLADCPSCRAVVESLKPSSDAELRLNTVPAAAPVTLEERATALAAGQIRWVAPTGADVRIPVLVLDVDTDEPADRDLGSFDETVHVAPLWTDRENATSSDLLLNRQDTTTGVLWRVAFRRQTVLPLHTIGSEIGELTNSGREKVSTALDGLIAPESSGPDIESEFDPRLSADDWLSEVIEQARATRPATGEGRELGQRNVFVSHHHAAHEWSVLRFAISPTSLANQEFALAAATPTWADAETLHASLEDAGVLVQGDIRWLGVSDRIDRLILHVEHVSGVQQPVILVVHTRDREPFEVRARLEPGADVVLAEDENITEPQVTGLELRLT